MAQLVEQRIRNAWVAGSSPAIGSLNLQEKSQDLSVLTFFSSFDALFGASAELAQLVEHWLPKPRVAGSSPVFRSGKMEKIERIRKKVAKKFARYKK